MFTTVQALRQNDGTTLAWRHQPPTATPRAILLISHGLAEHAARYRRFAMAMAKQGFVVHAHDHRGHGHTTGPDALQGRFARTDGIGRVLDDLKAVRDTAAALNPGLPVILFGHSMGGLIALNAAERDPAAFDALAVWNSNFHPGLAGRVAQAILAVHATLKGSDTPSHLLSEMSFGKWGRAIPGHTTPFDWLSHDAQEVAAYMADPLCGFDATVSLWRDLLTLSFDGAKAERLKRLPAALPIHLLGGGEDPATENGLAMRWLEERMRKAGLTRITCILRPGARHETLNDRDRDTVTSDFADWCLQAAGAATIR